MDKKIAIDFWMYWNFVNGFTVLVNVKDWLSLRKISKYSLINLVVANFSSIFTCCVLILGTTSSKYWNPSCYDCIENMENINHNLSFGNNRICIWYIWYIYLYSMFGTLSSRFIIVTIAFCYAIRYFTICDNCL